MKKMFSVAIVSAMMVSAAFAQDQAKPVVKATPASTTKKVEQAKTTVQTAAKPAVKVAEAKVEKAKTDLQNTAKKAKHKKHHKGHKAAAQK